MSSVPLRSSPRRPAGMKKEESFLGKLGGTLARKKKAREVSDLQEEGKKAINSPMSPALLDLHPEDTLLEENEERTMIDPTSRDDPKFKELVKVLIDWINDVLAEERIIVKQLEEDLYDGQVLQKLLEKLAGCKLNVAEVTQSEVGQKQKLQTVLETVQELLRPHGWALRWAVDAIHGKNLVAILHLLVSLATHFRAPIRLPEHVSVQVVVVRKREGLLHSSHVTEELTTTTEQMMGRFGTQPEWKPGQQGGQRCRLACERVSQGRLPEGVEPPALKPLLSQLPSRHSPASAPLGTLACPVASLSLSVEWVGHSCWADDVRVSTGSTRPPALLLRGGG
ncbi:beta-parvin isoform X2 [Molossus molossus]|uniref:beta-parvin isoform X2 n=1 Tax=Molossus molossus TaxID=27622 RepID=UPI001747C4DC|nr:beta-parvin isoform X2 [Molossus molossus]